MVTPEVDFREALDIWTTILGRDNVVVESNTLTSFARTTGADGTLPRAVLYPNSTEDVQNLVRAANRYGIPLHAISRGKNWGYGDASAPTPGQVIVNFQRMNRILEVNMRLGYAVIEPGVTQGQLCAHLQTGKTGLWMDATGAGPNASILGNALERGYGHTHYGDHVRTMCGLEVVLPNGELLQTGFGHLPQARATRVYPYGVGPFLDGIFTQSNFGIVTKMGLWLSPEPEAFAAFICRIDDPPYAEGDVFSPKLLSTIDKLSRLRMSGVLQSAVHIGNDMRILTSRARFPWDRADRDKALPAKMRAEMRTRYQISRWTFTGGIYGTKEHVKATRRYLRRELAPLKLAFMNDRVFQSAERAARMGATIGLENMSTIRRLREQVATAKPLYDLLKGIPSVETLRGAAWKTPNAVLQGSYDPLEAGSGILWQAPVLPATSAHARHVLEMIAPIFAKHDFDCPVTFAMVTERALTCVTNVLFDRTNASQTARALACHRDVIETLAASGYYSYRTNGEGRRYLSSFESPYWSAVAAIKKALDPGDIISPGYFFERFCRPEAYKK